MHWMKMNKFSCPTSKTSIRSHSHCENRGDKQTGTIVASSRKWCLFIEQIWLFLEQLVTKNNSFGAKIDLTQFLHWEIFILLKMGNKNILSKKIGFQTEK